MNNKRLKLLVAATTSWLAASMSWAQQWTEFVLPATLEEVPAKIEQQFGCTWQQLTEQHNITHLKITGQDFSNSWYSEGKQALRQLVVKARELDFSEVTANPDWAIHSNYYEGPDPFVFIEFMGLTDLDSLRRITFPKTLHVLYGTSLRNCDNLEEVVWPDNILQLNYDMFRNCKSLKQIDIPASIVELPSSCFRDCKQLTTVTLHEGLQKIGDDCFCYCDALTTIDIPKTVTDVGSSLFYACPLLASVTLPEGLPMISNSMFERCTSLTAIDIPSSVTTIGRSAFSECSALSSITLPQQVTAIGEYAFYYTSLEQFTMPDAVTSLGDYAFVGCQQLKTVHLSRALTSIPIRCFSDCQVLQEVNIPQRVTRIGHDAFVRCYQLAAPVLPEGLITLDEAAFWDTRFEQITLPSTLQNIGQQCFRYSRLTSINVPASVVSIGSGAFQDCPNLRQATLHEGLLYLLQSAFENCPLLEDVALPNSLRVLGDWVFNGNKSKKTYVQPPLINNVPSYICQNCENLTSVTLHNRITKIGNNAFCGCTQLAHIDLPEGLVTVGAWSFYNCPLTQVNIPATVRRIEDRAFNGGNYTRVVVPEGVESIAERAFLSKNLRVVDLPSTVAALGSWAFQGDGGACDSIVLRAAVPPRNWGGLYRNWLEGALYVPAQSVEAYKHNSGFSGFNTILPLTGYAIQNVVVAEPFSTDSIWFPVVPHANLTVTHNPDWNDSFHSGHLHVGNKVTWPVSHLRYDYQQPWQNYDWENQQPSATLINEGTMTAQTMELNLRFPVGQWLYFTPPFDMKASQLTCSDPRTPYVLRTFDGAQRAAGNHDHVWADVAADATLEAGHGYILQYGTYRQQSGFENNNYDNPTWKDFSDDVVFNLQSSQPLRTTALSSEPVTIPLQEYKSEYPHNEGWNFVANPFMSYFDIEHLDSDAPILVSDRSSFRTLQAVSPLDDDFVLKPLQAFLVQRSSTQQQVVFHPEGRQPDFPKHQEATNNARQLRRQALRQSRVRYDATLLHQSQQGDTLLARTRLVVTPRATEGYDPGQDAPFLTMDDSLTALYTRVNGLRYSLNEQPPTATSVPLGMYLAQAGTYTLAVSVKGTPSNANLRLLDRESGTITEITSQPYTFTVNEPATLNHRFLLLLGDGITDIEPVAMPTSPSEQLYDLQGRRISIPGRGLYIRGGKKYTHY